MRPEILKMMPGAVARTLPDEIGCDECFARLDQFTELILSGKPAAELMPLVHAHLERCPDCKDEFEAFLVALRAVCERRHHCRRSRSRRHRPSSDEELGGRLLP